MLVALGELRDRGHVDSPLVRERAPADVGRVGVGVQVGHRGHELRHLPEPAKPLGREHRVPQLELEVGRDRDQVHVAAPLAVPVDRPLHLGAPRLHRGERVGHREPGVIVRVDSEGGGDPGPRGLDPRPDAFGEGAAVGVAEHHPVGPGPGRGGQRLERVLPIPREPVEEVLGVEHDLLPQRLEVPHAVGDHAQVFRPAGLQHPLDVEGRALPDQRHHRGVRLDQRPDVGIVLAAEAGAAGASEGGHPGPSETGLPHPAEELRVLGIRARPAPLDIGDAQIGHGAGDLELVLEGESHPLPLDPVTQGGVVQDD